MDIGLISDHNILAFNFQKETRGFVVKESYNKIASRMTEILSEIDTNIICPFPMIGPENINRLIPETIINTITALNLKVKKV